MDAGNNNGCDNESTSVQFNAGQSKTMIYSVEETPPWYLCLLLGFQHYLTAFATIITVPIILSGAFCMDKDTVGLGELIGTIVFVCGICTLIQTIFGIRLPIVQGGSFSYLIPAVAIMNQPQWKCPYTHAREINGTSVSFEGLGLPEIGSEGHRDIWMKRLREIQGAIMVVSLFQVVVGFSGLLGVLLRFIGPLTVTPTLTLIGMSLYASAANRAAEQWWISLATMFLVTVFSQYLRKIKVPCITEMKRTGCRTTKLPIFDLFPVLLAVIISWIICVILTGTGVLPDDPDEWGYKARTDINSYVLQDSNWFRFPYPGQWGTPTVSASSVFGILPGVIASMVESVGDYYACAKLSGAPPPPTHAINRGCGMEGIGCILAGAIGTGNGMTSYSANIGVIGLTKVGSLRVVQVAGIIMIILGCLGKFGALFATIPDPVIGGMFMINFGMIVSVGLSNLQYVDLNSPRNLFVIGVSLFFGFSMPVWMAANPTVINTGNETINQIFTVLLSTSMFVGGLVGCVLDNTIPGTDDERGITVWRKVAEENTAQQASMHIYDFPVVQKYFDNVRLFKYIPICPTFLSKDKTDTYLGKDSKDNKNEEEFETKNDEYNTKF